MVQNAFSYFVRNTIKRTYIRIYQELVRPKDFRTVVRYPLYSNTTVIHSLLLPYYGSTGKVRIVKNISFPQTFERNRRTVISKNIGFV